MGLTDEDLAYMRETQAEHRPTAADLVRNLESVPDGMGGETENPDATVPVQVRIHGLDRRIPDALVTEYGASLVTITMDLVEVSSGDQIKVSPTEVYQVVSDGAVQDWTTAQQVYAVRRGRRQG